MGSARMIRRYYIKISLFESENDCDTNYAKKKKKKKKTYTVQGSNLCR